MYETTLKLTDEEREILEGKKGETLKKIMELYRIEKESQNEQAN